MEVGGCMVGGLPHTFNRRRGKESGKEVETDRRKTDALYLLHKERGVMTTERQRVIEVLDKFKDGICKLLHKNDIPQFDCQMADYSRIRWQAVKALPSLEPISEEAVVEFCLDYVTNPKGLSLPTAFCLRFGRPSMSEERIAEVLWKVARDSAHLSMFVKPWSETKPEVKEFYYKQAHAIVVAGEKGEI